MRRRTSFSVVDPVENLLHIGDDRGVFHFPHLRNWRGRWNFCPPPIPHQSRFATLFPRLPEESGEITFVFPMTGTLPNLGTVPCSM